VKALRAWAVERLKRIVWKILLSSLGKPEVDQDELLGTLARIPLSMYYQLEGDFMKGPPATGRNAD